MWAEREGEHLLRSRRRRRRRALGGGEGCEARGGRLLGLLRSELLREHVWPLRLTDEPLRLPLELSRLKIFKLALLQLALLKLARFSPLVVHARLAVLPTIRLLQLALLDIVLAGAVIALIGVALVPIPIVPAIVL